MIGQIGHLGEIAPARGRVAAGLYLLGSTLGAVLSGCSLAWLGLFARWVIAVPTRPNSPAVLACIAAAGLLVGLRDFGVVQVRFPEPSCQVPRGWLAVYGPCRASLLWGFNIGAGTRTRYRYGLLYVLGVWCFLSADPAWGAALLGAYGLSHGFAVVTAVALRFSRHLTRALDALPVRAPSYAIASGAVLIAAAPILAAAALLR